jgi:hypothetical protein
MCRYCSLWHLLQGLRAAAGDGLGAAVDGRPVLSASNAQRALPRCAGPCVPGVCSALPIRLVLRQQRPLHVHICHLRSPEDRHSAQEDNRTSRTLTGPTEALRSLPARDLSTPDRTFQFVWQTLSNSASSKTTVYRCLDKENCAPCSPCPAALQRLTGP